LINDGDQVVVSTTKAAYDLCCKEINVCKYICNKNCNDKKTLKESLSERIKFIKGKKK
jgi:hypothetical protein